MARRKPTLTVSVTLDASDDLNEIWRYNARERGIRQADLWDTFLKSKISQLANNYDLGRPVGNSPELQYVIARKRPKAHGHIIVFEVDTAARVVSIARVFHTKQDWQNKL